MWYLVALLGSQFLSFVSFEYPLAFAFVPLVAAFPLPFEPSSSWYLQAPPKGVPFEEMVAWKILPKTNEP